MFVNMAFVTPRPGMAEQMAEIMRSFAKALEGQPGLLKTFVLAEDGGKTLLGVSMWTDEDAFQKGMENVRPPPPATPAETLREGPVVIRRFAEI